MRIINVIESENNRITSVESWPIDDNLSEVNKNYFSRSGGVERAKEYFRNRILDRFPDLDTSALENLEDNGRAAFDNKLAIQIYWSGININE